MTENKTDDRAAAPLETSLEPVPEPLAESALSARLPGLLPVRPAGERSGLRRQLLRQVVAENVAVQAGALEAAGAGAAAPAISPAFRRRSWRAAALLPLLLVTLFFLWWRLRPAGATAAAKTAAAPPPAEAPVSAAEPALTTTRLKPVGAEVLGLGVHRIMLDPGHGGSDTGATVGKLAEKDLTLDIAVKLKERLAKEGFEVHLTRASDLTLTLRERSEMANLLAAHLFVSVHINWLPGGRGKRGVETYFVGATEDPELLELARRENVHSGYDMASNNQLLQKLFSDARQQNSQVFAQRVQQLLFSSLKPAHPELVDRGVKQAPFVVLVGTTMPAILAEVACLSSDQDAELLARPLYRESIAEALSRGIRRYADDVNPSQEKGS